MVAQFTCLTNSITPDLHQAQSKKCLTHQTQKCCSPNQHCLKKHILHIGTGVINVPLETKPPLQLWTSPGERVICFSEVRRGLADKVLDWRRHEEGQMLSSQYSSGAWKAKGLRPDKESLLLESISRLNLTYKQKVLLSNCLHREKLVPRWSLLQWFCVNFQPFLCSCRWSKKSANLKLRSIIYGEIPWKAKQGIQLWENYMI